MIVILEESIYSFAEEFYFHKYKNGAGQFVIECENVMWLGYDSEFVQSNLFEYIKNCIREKKEMIELQPVIDKLESIWKYVKEIEDDEKRELEIKKQCAKHGLSMMTALPEMDGALSIHEETV